MTDQLFTMLLTKLATTVLVLALSSCAHSMKVDPVEIKPIHMTVDVNVNTNGGPESPSPLARPAH